MTEFDRFKAALKSACQRAGIEVIEHKAGECPHCGTDLASDIDAAKRISTTHRDDKLDN